MASSTSFPAPGSRSKKPLGKMAGELKQTLNATLAPVSVVLIFLLAKWKACLAQTQGREAERLTVGEVGVGGVGAGVLTWPQCLDALWCVKRGSVHQWNLQFFWPTDFPGNVS